VALQANDAKRRSIEECAALAAEYERAVLPYRRTMVKITLAAKIMVIQHPDGRTEDRYVYTPAEQKVLDECNRAIDRIFHIIYG
jgi:hypothetical protein